MALFSLNLSITNSELQGRERDASMDTSAEGRWRNRGHGVVMDERNAPSLNLPILSASSASFKSLAKESKPSERREADAVDGISAGVVTAPTGGSGNATETTSCTDYWIRREMDRTEIAAPVPALALELRLRRGAWWRRSRGQFPRRSDDGNVRPRQGGAGRTHLQGVVCLEKGKRFRREATVTRRGSDATGEGEEEREEHSANTFGRYSPVPSPIRDPGPHRRSFSSAPSRSGCRNSISECQYKRKLEILAHL
ncbi:hypothetical protein C8R43DRAFT_955832 [Mycena crocata]|nr:hypothetical protein C8R43DRAFT_955832 [Mycena crocata]